MPAPQTLGRPPSDARDPTPHGALAELDTQTHAATARHYHRIEYGLLAGVGALVTLFAMLIFVLDLDFEHLNSYGYAGLFLISLISAASIVMPMPGVAAITGAGAVLDPVFGIPVPIMVGIVAGLAEALGEFTGYAAGFGGSPFFRNRPNYTLVHRWMKRRGMQTMFLLSCFPNPLVDVAGVAAGAVQMDVRRFFVSVLGGKFVKNVYLAAGGLAGAEVLQSIFG